MRLERTVWHDRIRQGLPIVLLSLSALLWGCGASTVDVVLPAEAKTRDGSAAVCRGVVAGKVTTLAPGATQPTATVTLESGEVAEIVLRDGVQAWVLDSGDIEFDVSGVAEGARPLPSGTKLVAARRNAVQQAMDRWATGWNLGVVVVGLLAMAIAVLVVRTLVRGALGLARLVVACAAGLGVAYLTAPALAPLIERHVYPLLESARDASASSAATAPEPPSAGAPTGSNRGADLEAITKAASERLGEWGRQAADALRNRPLPNPVYPAFFGLWLTCFLALASLLGKVTGTR